MAKMTNAQLEQFNQLVKGMHNMIHARYTHKYQQENYLAAVAEINEIINPKPEPEEEEP